MHLYELPLIFALMGLVRYPILAGAGIWQLAAGRRPDTQRIRDHAHNAMAAVWETSHVWLVFVVTVVWTAYPTAFGSIASTLSVTLVHRREYNPVGSANFVNPNLDVAYLEAWIAVDDETTAMLTIPEITGRYYTAQLSDEWGDVIVNINERTMPSSPSGRFALHAPGVTPPADAGVAIELHSRKAKVLARVEIADDLDGAVALQYEFTLTTDRTPEIRPAIELTTSPTSC